MTSIIRGGGGGGVGENRWHGKNIVIEKEKKRRWDDARRECSYTRSHLLLFINSRRGARDTYPVLSQSSWSKRKSNSRFILLSLVPRSLSFNIAHARVASTQEHIPKERRTRDTATGRTSPSSFRPKLKGTRLCIPIRYILRPCLSFSFIVPLFLSRILRVRDNSDTGPYV